jgi:hypothetical protein
MDVLHFTPGSLDPDNVCRHGTVAHMPLASGSGEFEISCLYLAPGGQIAVPPGRHAQLLLVVNGKSEATFPQGLRLEPSAGVGVLLKEGESCQLKSTTGAVIITLEGNQIEADPCGISSPQRVMGQQWPGFESN